MNQIVHKFCSFDATWRRDLNPATFFSASYLRYHYLTGTLQGITRVAWTAQSSFSRQACILQLDQPSQPSSFLHGLALERKEFGQLGQCQPSPALASAAQVLTNRDAHTVWIRRIIRSQSSDKQQTKSGMDWIASLEADSRSGNNYSASRIIIDNPRSCQGFNIGLLGWGDPRTERIITTSYNISFTIVS